MIYPGVAWDFIQLTPGCWQLSVLRMPFVLKRFPRGMRYRGRPSEAWWRPPLPECVRVCDINIRMPDCSPEVLRWSVAHADIIKVSEEELPLTFSFLGGLGCTHAAV